MTTGAGCPDYGKSNNCVFSLSLSNYMPILINLLIPVNNLKYANSREYAKKNNIQGISQKYVHEKIGSSWT